MKAYIRGNRKGTEVAGFSLDKAPTAESNWVLQEQSMSAKKFYSQIETLIYSGEKPFLIADVLSPILLETLITAGYEQMEEMNDKVKCFVVEERKVKVCTGAKLLKYKFFTIHLQETYTSFSLDQLNALAKKRSEALKKFGIDIPNYKPHKASMLQDFFKEHREPFYLSVHKSIPVFPETSDSEKEVISKASGGGYVYTSELSKTYQGEGSMYDCNSMYPSLALNKVLPVGEGIKSVAPEKELFITTFKATFELKKGRFPFVGYKKAFGYDYGDYASSGENKQFTMTSVEFNMFNEHYHVSDIEFIETYNYNGATGMFDAYINTNMELKETAPNSFMRAYYKNKLNILLGYISRNNGGYTPMFKFISAYGRQEMYETVMANKDRFLFCKTDSLTLMDFMAPEGTNVHETDLGAWKHEKNFTDCVIFDKRVYGFKTDGKWDYVLGNIPVKIIAKLNIEHKIVRGEVINYDWNGAERSMTV